jgi:hypothetical protein
MNLLLRLYFKKTIEILLQVALGILLISLVYFFYQSEVTVFKHTFFNPFYAYVKDLELWLYFVVCFIVVTFFLFFTLYVFSFYYDAKRKRNAGLTLRYEKFFAEKLSEFLLSERYDNKEERKAFISSLYRFTKKRIQIDALFSIYTRIQETLAIDLSSKFIILLKDIGLYHKQKSFLYRRKNDKRIIAMKMLSYLRINDYNDRILYYTKSHNYALRTEAYAALVRLLGNNDKELSFIGDKHRLSLLDINVVVNAVLKNFKTEIDYESLLTSNHVCKKIVGALLIKNRKLKEYNHLLFQNQYIETRNLLLRQAMWDSFLDLAEESDAVDAILEKFDDEPDEVKLLILEKSHEIEAPRFNDFIVEKIESQSLLVKIEILKILFNNDVGRFIFFKDSNDLEVKKAFNEVSDININ